MHKMFFDFFLQFSKKFFIDYFQGSIISVHVQKAGCKKMFKTNK